MRQKISRWLTLLAVCFMLTAYCATAQAALQAVGPTDPVTTLPTWYQDTTNRSLQLCLDNNGFCILPPTPIPPYTTTGPISDLNFPSEIFYFLADSTLPVNGDVASLRLAFEASFLNGVSPNTGTTFMRINLKRLAGLPANSTYTVTHPYGSFQFATDGTGTALAGSGAAFRTEDLAAPGLYFPPNLQAATNTHMGPFLVSTGGPIIDPISGNTYLGNPAVATTVTGSPTGNNFFRITGPNIGGVGINTVQTNLFNLSGKVFTGQIPSPMTIDRVTYAREATKGQIDAFVTALPTAIPSISGTGILTTSMTQDFPATGKFFVQLPFTTTLPSALIINNSLDIPPVPHPVTLVDEVNISQATYDPVTKNLTIRADSRDNVAPLPVLTVPALGAPNTLDATGALVKNLLNTIPPLTVTVTSSKGGSATAPVSVVTPPAPPVATADAATTAAGTPVVISVLTNDTANAPATINPVSVAITTQSLNGTAVVNINGTVTFTPAAGFSGGTTFAYTVKDSFNQTSNAATVTVTVNAPPTAAPVANADAATTPAGAAVVISVLANDTVAPPGVINPATVVISTQSLNGAAVANPAGTVTFTPAAGFVGTTTFAYTVKNTALQVSNAAVVTVTVTGVVPPATNIAPVAANDVASTITGTPRIITVTANDTDADGTINPASVVIVTPPTLGTAVNNLNGTVTYTPGAAGTDTFTYNVKDNLGAVSNNATVTVSVTSAITDAVNVLRAQFTTAGSQWQVEGTTTNVAPVSKTVTIYVGNTPDPLKILGTVNTNAADGRWKFQLPTGANPSPAPTNTISVALPSGASRLAFPVAVK